MNRKSMATCFASSVLTAGALMALPAYAAEPQGTAEIVVRSERPAVRSDEPVVMQVGQTETRVPIMLVEIRHHVSFDDLDLATATGADALVERVRTIAKQGCTQLDRMYPRSSPDGGCMKEAVRNAMPQIEAAIAEAKTRAAPG
ncbi:MAG: UrcA family protein [Gammaproteobacteria bacterium]|nr:UrcA family protein [Gammaproteobacteria bacterium]